MVATIAFSIALLIILIVVADNSLKIHKIQKKLKKK